MKESSIASIPMQTVGPLKLIGKELVDELFVPLATFESPLWPSVERGALVAREAGGITATLIEECMTRSVVVEASDSVSSTHVVAALHDRFTELQKVVEASSRYAKLKEWHTQVVGKLIYIRWSFTTGDASGHNMVTKAAEALLEKLLEDYPKLRYISISGNYCTDKKVSAVNGILGRGKYVIAEVCIPRAICMKKLRATPEAIVELHIKKNLIGSIIAGSLRSANAHFANMLLAFYLATGQDAANIVEGSQGIVHAELQGEDLYFSVTLPNIIVGTVGNGKDLDFVKKNLEMLGCLKERKTGENSKRLALIAGAVVLCGELSLLAAQTNRGELMKSHIALERKGQKVSKQLTANSQE